MKDNVFCPQCDDGILVYELDDFYYCDNKFCTYKEQAENSGCNHRNTTEKHLNGENGQMYVGCFDCNSTWQEEV